MAVLEVYVLLGCAPLQTKGPPPGSNNQANSKADAIPTASARAKQMHQNLNIVKLPALAAADAS